MRLAVLEIGSNAIRLASAVWHPSGTLELMKSRAEYKNQPFDEEAFRKEFKASNSQRVLAGRWCADEGYYEKSSGPEDAATLALFLASADSANMTGQDINTDGGVMW